MMARIRAMHSAGGGFPRPPFFVYLMKRRTRSSFFVFLFPFVTGLLRRGPFYILLVPSRPVLGPLALIGSEGSALSRWALPSPPGPAEPSEVRKYSVRPSRLNNSARPNLHEHKDVEHAKRGRHDHKETACHDGLGVVADEGHPTLLWVRRAPWSGPVG